MLPNLLVIGAQKCGTSSLHAYLDAHPAIAMSRTKELNFLIDPHAPGSRLAIGTWDRGLDWYAAQFPDAASVRGESSTNYSFHPHVPGVPERAARVVPGARLIYIVRDPIERLRSHHVHRVARGRERRSLEQALRAAESGQGVGYFARGLYRMQLERWLAHFPRERLLVIAQEDLLAEPAATLRRVHRFLGVAEEPAPMRPRRENRSSDQRALSAPARRLVAASGRLPGREAPARAIRRALGKPIDRPELSPQREQWLREIFAEDVERLRALTGERFARWSL